MKKILSLVLVLALCLSMAATVMAADNKVPSIGDKNAPDVVPEDGYVAELVKDHTVIDDGKITAEHMAITPVSKADSSDKIPEDAKEELKKVYEGLTDGSIKIPYDKVGQDPSDMEIRDLFDISLISDEKHDKELDQPNINLRLRMNLGVKSGDTVVIMVYVNGEWEPAQSVVNNGDGTVTCELTNEGPVAICVKAQTPPAQTGDANRNAIVIWGVALGLSVVALVALFVVYRKKSAAK